MRFPNVYGVDMPTRREFVAYDLSEDEICSVLGADGLIYQSLEDLLDAASTLNPQIHEFETSCFTGAAHPLSCHAACSRKVGDEAADKT